MNFSFYEEKGEQNRSQVLLTILITFDLTIIILIKMDYNKLIFIYLMKHNNILTESNQSLELLSKQMANTYGFASVELTARREYLEGLTT